MTTAKAAGVAGQVMVRADAAYFGWALVGAAIRHGAWFSVTARMNKKVTATIAAIPDDAWTPIKYPHAIWEETESRWVSDAEVAEVPFVAFTSRRKAQHVSCRLVVRRVKRLQPRASDGSEQGELFATWRYHAFITNSTLGMVQADEFHLGPRHRGAGHRGAQGRPNRSFAVRLVSSERSLGCPGGHRVQPRPRHRGRRGHGRGPVGDRPAEDHQRPRKGRDHRAAPDPAPTPGVALGRQLGDRVHPRHRTPTSRDCLTTQPTRAQPRGTDTWKSR